MKHIYRKFYDLSDQEKKQIVQMYKERQHKKDIMALTGLSFTSLSRVISWGLSAGDITPRRRSGGGGKSNLSTLWDRDRNIDFIDGQDEKAQREMTKNSVQYVNHPATLIESFNFVTASKNGALARRFSQ